MEREYKQASRKLVDFESVKWSTPLSAVPMGFIRVFYGPHLFSFITGYYTTLFVI